MYKVLLIDDEYMILNGLELLIPWEEVGFQVVSKMRNGKTALEYLEESPVDLVISDVTMPVKDGLAFLKESRERGFSFEAIMLSGYQEFEYVKKAMELGANGYLVKPVDEEELLAQLQEVKGKLIAKEQRIQQDAYLSDYLLMKWVKNEMAFSELSGFSEYTKQMNQTTDLTVIFLENRIEATEKQVKAFCHSRNQPFFFFQEETNRWVGVFLNYSVLWKEFSKQLAEFFDLEKPLSQVVGTTVYSVSKVNESYAQAVEAERINAFYGKREGVVYASHLEKHTQENLPFQFYSKLSQGVESGNMKEIVEEVERVLVKLKQLELTPELTKHLVFSLVTDLYQHIDFPEAWYQECLQTILKAADFHEICLTIRQTVQRIQKEWKATSYSPHVIKLLEIIKSDYCSDLHLKEVSERLFLNPVYAGQLFKREIGQSFAQYLNEYRISKVKEYLVNTDDSIGMIAIKTGYSTANYLSKNFRKVCGASPKEFRQTHTKKRIG